MTTAQTIAKALAAEFIIQIGDGEDNDNASIEDIEKVIDKALSQNAEQGEKSSSVEMDGCPTEGAVLKREWRAMYEILRMFQKAARDVMMPKEPRELASKFIQSVEHRCYYEGQKTQPNRFSDGTKIFPNRE